MEVSFINHSAVDLRCPSDAVTIPNESKGLVHNWPSFMEGPPAGPLENHRRPNTPLVWRTKVYSGLRDWLCHVLNLHPHTVISMRP